MKGLIKLVVQIAMDTLDKLEEIGSQELMNNSEAGKYIKSDSLFADHFLDNNQNCYPYEIPI